MASTIAPSHQHYRAYDPVGYGHHGAPSLAVSSGSQLGEVAIPRMMPRSMSSSSSISTACTRSAGSSTPLILSYSINKSSTAISLNGGALISPVRCHPSSTAIAGAPSSPGRRPTRSISRASFHSRRSSGSSTSSSPSPERTGTRMMTSQTPASPSSTSTSMPSPSPASPNRRYSLPTPPEQERFEELCRARFYRRDTDASRAIDRLLKDSAGVPSALNCYNRILASVRAKYHEDVAREREGELDRLMRVLERPDALMTREERKSRLQSFLETHVSKEMIGTHPFAKGLWIVLNLQATRSNRGGAGEWCLEWTIADEVFTEAGPREWTRDSVALLKTVLGFTDVTAQEASQAQTTSGKMQSPAARDGPEHASSSQPSDPFDDTHGAATPGTSMSSHPRSPPTPMRLSTFGSRSTASLAMVPGSNGPGVLQEGHQRTFRMSGDLSNPELSELASIFPSWIATTQVRSLHFPLAPEIFQPLQKTSAVEALEEGRNQEYTKESLPAVLKMPTGVLRISSHARSPGWEGTLVERVKVWIKRLLAYPC